jgi:dTDP-4-amino-4,6-dideoxygalactose transaminase
MTVAVPFMDLNAQYQAHREEFDAALAATIQDSAFIGGAAHRAFMTDFATWCGAGEHPEDLSEAGAAALVSNGTDALELALIETLGPGDGDREVITVSHTFIATTEAIARAGYRPVFVDIDPRTFLMDLDALERAIGPKTAAIIPVHIYGQMLDMPRLMDIARPRNLVVIEDAAQAHGARFCGKRPGAMSHAATFSFYPGKNLGAWGDAGAVYSRDEDLIARIRMRANHGRTDKYLHEFQGVNSRMDGLQAAILSVKLRHIDAWTAERRRVAETYDRLLEGVETVARPHVDQRAEPVYHLYVVRVAQRDKVRKALSEAGIATGVHYPVPLHMQPALKDLGHAPEDLPETTLAAESIISLPIFPEMADAQVERVVTVLKEATADLSPPPTTL